jgi:hypothetical protein
VSHIVSRNTNLVQRVWQRSLSAGRSTPFKEVGSLLLWSAAMEGTVGRRGCKPGVAIGGEMRATLDDMDFLELLFYALW